MNLLIGCALEKEVAILRRHLPLDDAYLVTGLGQRQTRKQLGRYFETNRPDLFVFTGAAGQLQPSLKMGETVFPESWCLQDGTRCWNHRETVEKLKEAGWAISGHGITVRKPVISRRARAQLFSESGSLICDMESAVALSLGEELEVPSLALKVVADTADSGIAGFWRDFDSSMVRLAQYLSRLIPCLERL